MIRFVRAALLSVSLVGLLLAQPAQEPPDNRAGAYYNFAMGRLYAGLAGAESNKADYVAKAIQHYQEALKLDPSSGIIFEELTDLYIQTNRLRDAVTQAEDLLKQKDASKDALEAKATELSTAAQKLGEIMYAQSQQAAGGGDGGAGGGGGGGHAGGDGGKHDEKVVDAEYTEVKDRK